MGAMQGSAKMSEMMVPPAPPSSHTGSSSKAKLKTENLNFFYGSFQALHDINLEVPEKRITALIGPSGCGKSTLLKAVGGFIRTEKWGPINKQDVRKLPRRERRKPFADAPGPIGCVSEARCRSRMAPRRFTPHRVAS